MAVIEVMFTIIRKAVVLGAVGIASVAVWEAGRLGGRVDGEIVAIPELAAMQEGAGAADQGPADIQHTPAARAGADGRRWLVWAVFVLLLPIATAPLAGRIIDKESNAANVLMLFGYTGLGVLGLHIVCGVQVTGILSAVLYLTGLLATFAYNLWICGLVAGLRR